MEGASPEQISRDRANLNAAKRYEETGMVGEAAPKKGLAPSPDMDKLETYQTALENSLKDAHAYSLPKSALAKIAKKDPVMADNIGKYFDSTKKWQGQLTNKAMRPIYKELTLKEWLQHSSPDVDLAVKFLRDNYGTSDDVFFLPQADRAAVAMQYDSLPPRVKRIVDAIRPSMVDVRSNTNLRKGMQGGEFHEFYSPDRIDPDKVVAMANGTPDGLKWKNQLYQRAKHWYLTNQRARNARKITSPQDAEKAAAADVDNIIKAYTELDTNVNLSDRFGPLYRAAGYGVPDELLMSNKLSMLESYFNRAGRNFAYYDYLQGTDFEKALKNRQWQEDPNFRAAANRVTGENLKGSQIGEKISALVRSSWLGTLTGLRDIPSSLALNIGHAGNIQMARALKYALLNARKGMDSAFVSGLSRESLPAIESGLSGVNDAMMRMSNVMTTAQGRQAAENFSRSLGFLVNEFLALDNLKAYKRAGGNLRKLSRPRRYFVEKFGEDAFQRALKTGSFSEQDLLNVARRAAEASQSTYGPGGLPAWAMEGWTAPFAALSRFSIEQTLRMLDIVGKQGPMGVLRILGAGVLAGEGIREMTNLLTGRVPSEPTIDEMESAYKQGWNIIPPVAYRMVSDLSAAAFGGIATDLVKSLAQHLYAGEVMWDQFTFPAIEAITGINDEITDLIEAGMQGELDMADVATFADRVAQNNIQGLRLMLRNFPTEEEWQRQQRAKETQEYRRYQMLAPGMRPPQRQEIRPNLYMNEDVREFQQLPFNSPRKWELAAKINQRAMSLPFDRGQAMLRSARTRQWRGGPADELNLMRYLMFKQKADGASSLQPLMQSKMQNDLTRQLVQSAIFPPMR